MKCLFVHDDCIDRGCGDWCPQHPPVDVDEALSQYADAVGNPALTEKQRMVAVHVHAAMAACEPAKGNGRSVIESFVAYHRKRT